MVLEGDGAELPSTTRRTSAATTRGPAAGGGRRRGRRCWGSWRRGRRRSFLTPSFGRRSDATPVPKRCSAPSGPTAFGRWKIQFCQAVSRAKILVSIVSGPTKRRLASMPVSASGEKLARSSRERRTSSSQSRSSGAKVTRPAASASAATSCLPSRPRARQGPPPAPRSGSSGGSGRWPSGTSRRWRR